MEPILKIKENLFIKDQRYIISYETTVAEIIGDKIEVNAQYSRTTSKHINEVADIFKISRSKIFKSKERGVFWDHSYGVRCQMDNALSPEYSMQLIEEIMGGKTFFQALALCSPQKRKDKAITNQYFESIGYDLKTLQDSRDLGIVFA